MRTIDEDIKNQTYKTSYLLYGEEAYLKKQYKDKTDIKEALVLSCLSAGEGWVLLCFCQFLSSEGCKNCTWIQQR